MRYLTLFILTITLYSCTQKAEKKSDDTSSSAEPGNTEIVFTESSHDFGKLEAGEIVLFSFVFTNKGTNDYLIKEIHSDCGCVKTNFPEHPVQPGDTGVIEVELDTSGLVGKEYKTIELLGNTKELKHLAIFAEVKNELLDIKY